MIRRSLSIRVLIVTVVAAAGLGAGLHFAHSWQVGRIAKGLLVLAAAQEGQDEWIQSAEFLDRYLRLQPRDGEARVRLALTYAKGAETYRQKQRATELHYRALAVGLPSHELELRRSLAGLLTDTGRWMEVEKESRRLLEADSHDADANRYLALALVGQLADGSLAARKTDEIGLLKTVEKARELNPGDVRLAGVLASLYREFPQVVLAERPGMTEPQRHAKADESLIRLVDDNPELAAAYLSRHVYRTQYGLPDALADLQAALRLAPDDPDVLLTAAIQSYSEAQAQRRSGGSADVVRIHLEESQQYYEKLAALPPQRQVPAHYLGLGDARLALDDLPAAVATWQEGARRFSQPTVRVAFHARIAEAYLEGERLSEAGEALDAVDAILAQLDPSVSRDERTALSRAQDLRRGAWRVQRRDIAAAIPLLRQVVITQPKGDANTDATVRAWLLLGSVYGSLGEWLDAATAFDQAASLQPTLHRARVASAGAWLSARRPDLAIERAEQALTIESTLEAWSALAAAHLQQQALRPAHERSWLRLEQALAVLEQAKPQIDAAPWRIDLLRADYLVAKARTAGNESEGQQQAAALLKGVEAQYADRKEFWFQAAVAYQNLHQPQDAERAIAAYRAAGATPGESALAQARLASMRQEHDEAIRILNAASEATPLEREALRVELLRAAYAKRDMALVRQMLVEDHRRQPQNLTVIQRLADIDLEREEYAAVAEWERKLDAAGTLGDPLARYYRAWRKFVTARSGDDPELHSALREMEQVVLLRPNWAEAASLKGMIQHRLGRVQQAVADYERAVQLGERRVLVFENLIALLDRLNRSSDVERYLARLEADVPLSQRLTEMATAYELRRDRPEHAIEIARQNAKQRPHDPQAHLWLGRLLATANQHIEAQAALARAIELAPADQRAWSALVSLHAKQSDREALQQTLDRLADNMAIAAAEKNVVLGQAHEALGDLEAAREQFEAAAAAARSDLATQLRVAQFYLQREPAKAVGYLRRALEIDATSVAARRLLAIALATQGELAEAEKLLAAAGQDGQVAAEDQRLHAILLAQQGGVRNLASAVQILEELVAEAATAQVADRLLLARLYEQQSGLTDDAQVAQSLVQRARDELTAVAERSDADVSQIAGLVQFLVRRQMTDDVPGWLDRLERKADAMTRDDADAIALVAQVCLQAEQPQRSLRWLDKLDKLDASPLRALSLRAQALAALKQDAEIETLIEGRAEALLAKAAADDARSRTMSGVAEIYMATKQYAAAERWYRRLHAEDPKQFPLLAGVLTRQGRVGEALALCQDADEQSGPLQPALVAATALVEGAAKADDFEQAEPLFEAALRAHPDDARLLYAVALVRVVQGRDAASVPLFRKVVEINPKFVPALNNLAMLLAEDPMQRTEALRLIDQAIEIAGKDANLLDTKGAILVYSGRSAEAVPPLEASIRAPQADPRHHFHLALAYHDQGKTDEAKAQLKTALDRQLESLVLTPTDQRLLRSLRTALAL